MTRPSMLTAMLLVVTLTGCYHATIRTGLTPEPTTTEEDWAHSFLWGLVPPETIEADQECPNGLASVETKHSLLNQLVAGLTGGIYSPMTIVTTCGE